MDFDFTLEHKQLRDTVRRHTEEEMRPHVAEADDTERFSDGLFRRWGELGLIGARYPEADGGIGMDKVSDCIIREELGRVGQAFCAAFSPHSHLGIQPIWRAGTPKQKEAYFVPAISGEKVACFGLSEPDGGSNIRDCMVGVTRWNRAVKRAGHDFELTLPSRRFRRSIGNWSGVLTDPKGNLISRKAYERGLCYWLPTEADRAYVRSLMKQVIEPAKMASWIAPPDRGINNQPVDYEYVELH